MKIQVPAVDMAAVSAPQSVAINAAIAPALARQSAMASQLAASILPNLDNILPKVDLSSYFRTHELVQSITLPHIEWFEQFNQQLAAQVLPKIAVPNLDNLLPKIDLSSYFHTLDLAQSITLPHIEWLEQFNRQWAAQILPKLTFTRFELPAGMLKTLGNIDWDLLTRRSRVPSNWPDEYEEHLPTLLDMVNAEGIPVAWVPRQNVLIQLLDAESAHERSELLIANRGQILEDCVDWVESLDNEFLAPLLPVAKKVLAACRDGHWEVAAISAVAVVHAVVESLHWASDRQRARKHHRLTMELPLSQLLEQSTRAPLVLFYEDWNPKSGKPRPDHLTRHVVSHQLAEDQVSDRNCVIAVMLMSSLLVSVEQLELGREEVAA